MMRGLPSQHPLATASQKQPDERGFLYAPNTKRSAMSHYHKKETMGIVDKSRVTRISAPNMRTQDGKTV